MPDEPLRYVLGVGYSGSAVSHTVTGTLDEAKAAGFRHVQCRCEWVPFVDGTDFGLLTEAGTPADALAKQAEQADDEGSSTPDFATAIAKSVADTLTSALEETGKSNAARN